MMVRILLLAALTILFIWILGQRVSSRGQAWSKLLALPLFILALAAVVAPELVNDVAHAVGVGRGADLLLYCLTVAFLALLIEQYLHRQDERAKFNQLARKIAVLEAVELAHNKEVLISLSKKST